MGPTVFNVPTERTEFSTLQATFVATCAEIMPSCTTLCWFVHNETHATRACRRGRRAPSRDKLSPCYVTISIFEFSLLRSSLPPGRSIRLMTNSRRSQSEKQWASRARETAATKPHNKKSQANTTNGTRVRGRREPGQKPRPHTGPVLEISGVVRRHRAQPCS
jgi:hypothetical protein